MSREDGKGLVWQLKDLHLNFCVGCHLSAGISNDVGVKSKDTAADEELLPDDPLSYLKLESQKRLNQIKEGLAGLQESLSLLSKGEGWRQEWWSYWKERGLAEWYDAVAASLAGDLGPDEVSPFPVAPPSPKVALVYALGPIDTGSQGGLSRRDNQIDSSRVCAHLEELRHDKAIRAVVLRVDSPGGSAVASDAIHRELSLLRKSGKPVVVSMGNVAASGGYYIACAADKILASPATVTGSIGVLIFKLNAHGLLEDKGVNVETVKVQICFTPIPEVFP